MKSYTITVNGVAYDVTVEENKDSVAKAPVAPAKPVAKPAAKQTQAPVAKSSGAGSIKVAAGAAGKVFKVEKNVGDSVNKGDTVLIIEAMKMEIPVVAPEAGTVASIDVKVGDAIEAGATLATLN
ncbi:hypothetical protein P261_01894 [Lachnospiraceae bacterium TWA4]|nr:hypothetical protein P261_01894 [Lachnospiraceae bacterium TWA4]